MPKNSNAGPSNSDYLPLIQPQTTPTSEFPLFIPTEKERNVVRETFFKFRYSQDQRNRAFEFFDGRTLIEYINDSTRRFVTNIFEREGLEDWQARVHDPFTRNKVLAILGKVVDVLPKATFQARGDEDIRKASIISDLYEYSEDIDNYEEFMTNFLLEAIVKGTAIGYEGMEHYERKVRDVRGTGDDVSVKESIRSESTLYAEIVPLEEFYPAHVGIRNVRDMPYCFWRHEMSYDEFKGKYQMYAKTKFVQPHAPLSQWREQRPFYADFISTTVQPGNVELIRLYDKTNDVYVFLANGVWLNPLGEMEEVSPLPFNHKELPFFDVKFDFLGNWFYGKSLPDRLQSLQDVLNVLTNMLLDQSFLTIFPPLLTAGNDAIEDDYLRPGRRTPIDTQGLPLNQAYAPLELGTPQGWHQFILEYTRKIMEEASVDQLQSGNAGVGGRTTATEIGVAASGVASVLGLFGRMINSGLKRKAMLRAKNILQFWTDPKSPRLIGVLGDDGADVLGKAFNLFKVDGTTLSHGTRGTKVIAMFKNEAEMPTHQELKVKSAVKSATTGKKVEYMAINAEYLQNLDFNVKIVMDQTKEATKDIQKALQLEKVKTYMTFFPQQVNVAELAAETAEKLGDDPAKILNDNVFTPPKPGSTPQPNANVAQNMLPNNPMQGGMQQLKQTAGSMTG